MKKFYWNEKNLNVKKNLALLDLKI